MGLLLIGLLVAILLALYAILEQLRLIRQLFLPPPAPPQDETP